MPVLGIWNGDRTAALRRLAVMGTTEVLAAATIPVMSSPVTVVWLTEVAFEVAAAGTAAGAWSTEVRTAAVPPDARTAERRLMPRRPASPRPPARGDRGAGDATGSSWGGGS